MKQINSIQRRTIIVSHYQNPLFLRTKKIPNYLFLKTKNNNCHDYFEIGFNLRNQNKIELIFLNKSCALATTCLDLICQYLYLENINYGLNLIAAFKNFLKNVNFENEIALINLNQKKLKDLVVFSKLYLQKHRYSCLSISLNLIESVLKNTLYKNKIRTQFKEKLLTQNKFLNSLNSILIQKLVIKKIKESNFKNIGIYLNNCFEVKTKKIIKYCLRKKINLYVPKIISNKKLVFIKINQNTTFKFNKFKIKEPIINNKTIFLKQNKLQVLILPCLFFILNPLKRFGYGSGYFDSYLNNYCFQNNNLKLWLLAFKCQELKNKETIKKIVCYDQGKILNKIFF